MAVYRNKGIVLRSIRFGEADRILDLYTQDAGLTSAIAKGIRKTKSKFGARLEPLSCVDFMAYTGRSLDTLTQAETLRSFHEIREDLIRFEAAARMVGYVKSLSGGDEADRRVFNLLYHALDALEGRESGFEAMEAAFGMKLAILAGYAPQLDACVECGMEPGESEGMLRFAPGLGGILCVECDGGESRDSFPMPPGSLEGLRAIVRIPLKELPETGLMGEALRRVVRSHVIAHAPSNALVSDVGGGGRKRPA
ncbi:MAG: DNA repair protein RecO [Rubrobacteraceae bacterium]|jgi:DNA repair protein RecO (recombination protein O)